MNNTYRKEPDNIRGNRIFGVNGKPELHVVGSRVVNGEWNVKWLNDNQTEGRCIKNFSYTFSYICHAPDGRLDYNDALHGARIFLSA